MALKSDISVLNELNKSPNYYKPPPRPSSTPRAQRERAQALKKYRMTHPYPQRPTKI
jgi:hypothetical protein